MTNWSFFDAEGKFIPPEQRTERPESHRYHTKGNQSDSLGLTPNPSVNTGFSMKTKDTKNLSSLVPDWERRRKMCHFKKKTLFKVFLSKWFHEGLDYHEKELLLILRDELKINVPLLDYKVTQDEMILRNSTNYDQETKIVSRLGTIGINLVGASLISLLLYRDRENKPINLKGFDLLEQGVTDLDVYSEQELRAIWGLRSFQSLRDSIFQPFKVEQGGKTGIRKPRQRGYTDGRGGSGDTKRIALALECDRFFWSTRSEDRWKEFYQDLEKLAQISF